LRLTDPLALGLDLRGKAKNKNKYKVIKYLDPQKRQMKIERDIPARENGCSERDSRKILYLVKRASFWCVYIYSGYAGGWILSVLHTHIPLSTCK
jgi:hypothetical protein